MKKKIIMTLVTALTVTMFAACGSSETASTAKSEAASSAASSVAASSVSVEDESAVSTVSASNEAAATESTLPDGVYTAVFKSDNSMFHVNETLDDQGELTVENGQMTMHITLESKNIVNLFPGTAEDAQKDGAVLLQPTTDQVTYDDGITDEVYGFDIPVPALDQEFDLALIGTKGKWYDHKVTVSLVNE